MYEFSIAAQIGHISPNVNFWTKSGLLGQCVVSARVALRESTFLLLGLRVVVLGYKSSFNFMAERANKVWAEDFRSFGRLDFLR